MSSNPNPDREAVARIIDPEEDLWLEVPTNFPRIVRQRIEARRNAAFAKADQIISSLQDGTGDVPEGWKLVPLEPTAVQIVATAVQAGDASHADYELAKEAVALLPRMGPLVNGALEVPDILAEIARDYRSMLKAAPLPAPPSNRAETQAVGDG